MVGSVYFFFSSRRRHTRCGRDWSSDVCSSDLGRQLVFRVSRKRLGFRGEQYPALPAALRAIETGLKRGLTAGLKAERDEFCRLLFTPTCRHLLEVFFQRERARKPATWSEAPAAAALKTVAVIGAGTMGAGIAQLIALQGFDVILKEIRPDLVEAGMRRVEALIQDAVKAGALDAQTAALRQKAVTGTTEWDALSSADLAIEAVVERLEIKQEVFRELDRRLPSAAPIVSNTSALPIAKLAAATGRAAQVAGLHFFNPVHRMSLVEVVRCPATSEATTATLV